MQIATAKKKPFGSPPVPPLAGHKCVMAQPCWQVHCECGWVSCPHSGPDSRGAAYSEWRDHVRDHHKKALHDGAGQ